MYPQTKRLVVEPDDDDLPAGFSVTPRKVALVAAHRRAMRGYAPLLAEIAAAVDAEGCDTIVYGLAPGGMRPADRRQLFGEARGVTTIIVEVADPDRGATIEVWRRAVPTPHRFRQQLVTSQDPVGNKRALIRGLPARTLGSTLVLACGEVNIVSTQRGSTATLDPFEFMPRLAGRRLILNPAHTYMIRHEMREKRRRYSQEGRVVLSVWNPGYAASDAEVPWQAFVNGEEVTGRVARVRFSDPLIEIGAFDLG